MRSSPGNIAEDAAATNNNKINNESAKHCPSVAATITIAATSFIFLSF